MKKLAKIVGVDYNNAKKGGNLYKQLKMLGIKGYATGSRHIQKDQLALMAENGMEIHYDKDEGVLETVGSGDKVFTNEMADNLWEMAKMTPEKAASLNRGIQEEPYKRLTQEQIMGLNEMLKIPPEELIKEIKIDPIDVNIPMKDSIPSGKQMNGDVNVNINELSLPNVKNYDEFIDAMFKDKNFRLAISDMVLNPAVGRRSTRSKYKF